MGFLKRMTIKSTTTKRASMLRVVLDQSGDGKKTTLKEFVRLGSIPVSFEDEATWDAIFCYIIWAAVCSELSYDPSIGNNADKELSFLTCLNLLIDWYPDEIEGYSPK